MATKPYVNSEMLSLPSRNVDQIAYSQASPSISCRCRSHTDRDTYTTCTHTQTHTLTHSYTHGLIHTSTGTHKNRQTLANLGWSMGEILKYLNQSEAQNKFKHPTASSNDYFKSKIFYHLKLMISNYPNNDI